MTHTQHTAAADFVKAVHAGAFDAAAAALPLLTGTRDESLRRAIADLHAHLRHWTAAAEALVDLPGADARLRRNLYRNLAALKTHRPAAYRVALAAIESEAAAVHRPHALPGGAFTVARVDADGQAVPLDTDPAARVSSGMQQLGPMIENGESLAFLSIGDGHVLAAVAASPAKLFLDRQQPLFLIEPDPGQLLACLLIHDFTGPLGPIEQPRVAWHVGPKWADSLRMDVLNERCVVFPKTNIKQGPSAMAIEAKLLDVLSEMGRRDAAAEADIARYYAALTPDDYAAALAGRAGRPPRVLLLTTRFSTVLQHATRDADDGLRRLGCETFLLIEPTPYHGLTRSAMRRTIAEFKPDLVFQIDHHRFEHGHVFPIGLPFVNWIQDLLPHLMTPAAGRQLGDSDFVLTPSRQRWVDDFAYPERQCLEFRKLTRVPDRPRAWQSDDERVVYVSNWSQSPEAVSAELLAGLSGVTRDVTAEACGRMIRLYESGGALPSTGDVRRVLEKVVSDLGAAAHETLIRQTATRLFDRLNNVLYRQQGLAWAADACRALGLTLEIYGNGWADHPRFAAHARGPIAYGRPLEELTRRAGVNLILEPFMCLSHQRLLDALSGGGFCLLRDHSANHTTAEWIDLLAKARPDIADAASLRAMLSGDDRRRFDTNMAECHRLDVSPEKIDHVAIVRRLQCAGFYPTRGEPLPLLDRVGFTTADGLSRLLCRASRDAEYRTTVAATQRQVIEERFGYHAGMARVLDFIGGRLAPPSEVPMAPLRAAA